jgi:hypothetical protein
MKQRVPIGATAQVWVTKRADKKSHQISKPSMTLAAGIENITRQDLGTGAVSSDGTYWKAVEKQFNEGFHENSVYCKAALKHFNEDFPEKSCYDPGPVFADNVHFRHPNKVRNKKTVDKKFHIYMIHSNRSIVHVCTSTSSEGESNFMKIICTL